MISVGRDCSARPTRKCPGVKASKSSSDIVSCGAIGLLLRTVSTCVRVLNSSYVKVRLLVFSLLISHLSPIPLDPMRGKITGYLLLRLLFVQGLVQCFEF